MRLVKLDYGAEARTLERYKTMGQYYEVVCPFCNTSNVFYYRNFCAGVRCKDPNCRAMMRLATHDARKDMLPKEETILRHGLVTRPGAEGRSWEEWKVVVT